jgi:hypothetical protein
MRHIDIEHVVFAIAAAIFVVGSWTQLSQHKSEHGAEVLCFSGGQKVYHREKPLDFVIMDPLWVVVEEEEGTVNIINAACVVREP